MSVFYTVLACVLWSFSFLGPVLLNSFSCIDIVLGRFFVFGIVSVLYFSHKFSEKKACFAYWPQAAISALAINFGCFIALTLGIRFSSAAVIALIIGMAPMVITTIECRKTNQPFIKLIGPIVSIILGIILVNMEALRSDLQSLRFDQYIVGLFLGGLALTFWVWYILNNTKFLQDHPEINPIDWTAMLGVASLVFSLLGILIRGFTIDSTELIEFSLQSGQGYYFLLIVTVLGIFSTWCAFILWNMASSKLPPTLMGQLAILETVFALGFIYLVQHQWPTVQEITGIIFIIGGVWRGLVNYQKQKAFLSLT